MIERLRAHLAGTAFGPVMVVWTLGYALIAVSASLIGRMSALVSFVTDLPLLLLGAALTMGLEWLWQSLGGRPFARWPLLAVAVLGASVVQTFADLMLLRWYSVTIFPAWQSWAY